MFLYHWWELRARWIYLPHSTDSSDASPQSLSWSQTNRWGMHALLRQRNELSSHVLLGAGVWKEGGSNANQWINISFSAWLAACLECNIKPRSNPLVSLFYCLSIVKQAWIKGETIQITPISGGCICAKALPWNTPLMFPCFKKKKTLHGDLQ